MPPQATVRLFGKLLVTVDGSHIRIRTKPAQSLLALLCTKPGQPIERTQIAESIWSDLPYSTAGNRLRTTLVILKQALEPWQPLDGDRHSIWIDADPQAVDLSVATGFAKRVRVLQDLDQELEALQGLLAIIDQPFLVEFDDSWIGPIRQSWIDQRTTSLLRIAQLQEEFGYLSEGLAAVERVFEIEPYHSQSWMKFLRLVAQTGKGEDGLQRFNAQQGAMMEEFGVGFGADVQAVAGMVRHGAIQPNKERRRFSANERKVLISALEHMAASSPDDFLGLVASRSFAASTFHKPTAAFGIVLDSVDAASEAADKEAKAQAIRAGIVASINLSDHRERENLAQMLVDQYPEESVHHLYGLAQLSFLKFEQREMESAYELGHKVQALADSQALPPYQRLMKTNLAGYDWHSGKLKEAEATYLELYDEFKDAEDVMHRYNLAVITINLGIVKSMQLDWAASHDYCQEGWRVAVLNEIETVRTTVEPVLGCAKVMLGSREGLKLIVDGLKDGYRLRNTRMVEISLDFAACALIHLGDPETGLAIVDAVTFTRASRLHFRSVAEQSFADWVRVQAGDAKPNQACGQDPALLNIVMAACDAIENLN